MNNDSTATNGGHKDDGKSIGNFANDAVSGKEIKGGGTAPVDFQRPLAIPEPGGAPLPAPLPMEPPVMYPEVDAGTSPADVTPGDVVFDSGSAVA